MILSAGYHKVQSHENTERRIKEGSNNDRDTLKTFISPSSAEGFLFTKPELMSIF